MEIAIVIFVIAVIFIARSVKVVPQQNAWVKERLGKYAGTLTPGLNFLVPFVDKVAYKHSLKEIPLDVPSQICITRDNTQLQVDGILYFQVTDPMRASYGSSNYIMAISQLAQTTLRSIIGRLELDKTFEERDMINAKVVEAIDEAALNWGVKVLRYEIKDLTPPAEILRSMQAQITAEREKRAVIATSEGKRQEQINLAEGQKQAAIAKSEGEKQAQINNAEGEAAAITAVAEASAKAIAYIAQAIERPAGAIDDAAQQLDPHRQVARAVLRPAPPVRHAARRRQHAFDGEHARAGHDAFGVTLRHQEQALALEPDHFGLDLAAGGGDRAGRAHGQAQADAFHHQARHARDAARNLQRLGKADERVAIADIRFPARRVAVVRRHLGRVQGGVVVHVTGSASRHWPPVRGSGVASAPRPGHRSGCWPFQRGSRRARSTHSRRCASHRWPVLRPCHGAPVRRLAD